MSVAKFAAAGAGLKNVAVGVAIFAGVAAVVYVGFKVYGAATAVKKAVVDAGTAVAEATDMTPGYQSIDSGAADPGVFGEFDFFSQVKSWFGGGSDQGPPVDWT